MKRVKVLLGVFFLIVGGAASIGSIYLLQEDRLVSLFDSDSNLKVEIGLLLIFSILLCYSGFKTIQKEYKKEKFKQSELLDD
jgi:hypothetical protein